MSNIIQFNKLPTVEDMVRSEHIVVEVYLLEKKYPGTLSLLLNKFKNEYAMYIPQELHEMLEENNKDQLLTVFERITDAYSNGKISARNILFAYAFIRDKLGEPEKAISYFADAIWLIESGEKNLIPTDELTAGKTERAQRFTKGFISRNKYVAEQTLISAKAVIAARNKEK